MNRFLRGNLIIEREMVFPKFSKPGQAQSHIGITKVFPR